MASKDGATTDVCDGIMGGAGYALGGVSDGSEAWGEYAL